MVYVCLSRDPERSVFTSGTVQVQDDIGLVSEDQLAVDMEDLSKERTEKGDSACVMKSHYENIQHLAIRAQTRFRVSPKIQNAELLLQRMFEGEL